MKIVTKKVVHKNFGKAYEIVEIEGVLPEHDLPDKYVKDYPHIHKKPYSDIMKIFTASNHWHSLCVGDVYSEKAFFARLDRIRKAGQRLSTINKKLRELEANWKGEETFIV